MRITIGDIQGDSRSLDYSSHGQDATSLAGDSPLWRAAAQDRREVAQVLMEAPELHTV